MATHSLPPSFPYHAGSVALNFVATLEGRASDRPAERLEVGSRLGRWFVELGLLTTAPAVAHAELAEALSLREAVHETVVAASAGRALPAQGVATINRFAQEAPPRFYLAADGYVARTSSTPVRAALAAVARDAIDLVVTCAADLRACEDAACGAYFLDTSRGKRRRWCSMERCGNREKVRAFRRRSGT